MTPGDRQPERCRVIACPRPFSVDRLELSLQAGPTIAQILDRVGMGPSLHARVFIDDRLAPEAEWLTAKPAAGKLGVAGADDVHHSRRGVGSHRDAGPPAARRPAAGACEPKGAL